MFKPTKPKLIGICGGSASGKTSISDELRVLMGSVEVISMDNYFTTTNYKVNMSREEYLRTHNFDSLESFNVDLFVDHLRLLCAGKSVSMPLYDYSTSTYIGSKTIYPSNYILVDGILLLASEKIRNCLDLKIYVDCNKDIRYSRRLRRDTKERGASYDIVKQQLNTYVKEMHNILIEPNKIYANILIDNSESLNNKEFQIKVYELYETIKRKFREIDLLSGNYAEMC